MDHQQQQYFQEAAQHGVLYQPPLPPPQQQPTYAQAQAAPQPQQQYKVAQQQQLQQQSHSTAVAPGAYQQPTAIQYSAAPIQVAQQLQQPQNVLPPPAIVEICQEMTSLVGKLMSANEENVKKNAQLQADNVKLQQSLMERDQNLDEVSMKLIELERENDQLKLMASLNGGSTTTPDADDNGGDGIKGSASGQENKENGNRSQSVIVMSSAISLSDGQEEEEDVVCIGEKESADAKYFSRMINFIKKLLIEKKLAVAEFICTQIFAELMEKYGRNHSNLAVFHDLLARTYRYQGHYSRSRAELEELLQIHEQNSNQHGIAYALNAIMFCYAMEKKYEKAIQTCHKAVVIYKEIYGTEQHPDVGKQLYDQALIYDRHARSGGCIDFNEVERTYKRALDILEATLGNDHERTIDCRRKLAKLTGNQQQQERNILSTRPNKASGSQQAAVITID